MKLLSRLARPLRITVIGLASVLVQPSLYGCDGQIASEGGATRLDDNDVRGAGAVQADATMGTEADAGGADVNGSISDAAAPLPDGRVDASVEPEPVDAATPAAPDSGRGRLAVARETSCWLRADGDVYCWGRNDWHQFGAGPINQGVDPPYHPAPVLTAFAGVRTIGLSRWVSFGLDGEGVLWGAGRGANGGFPYEAVEGRQTDIPVRLESVSTPADISHYAASYHVGCAVAGGRVYCTGRNSRGGVGDGSTEDRSGFVDVGLSGVTDLTGGYYFMCAVAAGQVLCWGGNEYGQMGDGGSTDALSPKVVPLPVAVAQVSAGSRHACALAQDGTVFCWGDNWNGMVGSCSAPCAPTVVPGVSDVVQLAAGGGATCALLEGGRVTCWGEDYPVGGLTGAVELASGHESSHFCALVEDGGAEPVPYCWGGGSAGQLGRGSLAPPDPRTPAPIALP